MTQKKKGRPFKTEAKKDTRIAVKVTKETFQMLNGVKKSDILNDGLAILLPTLGFYDRVNMSWLKYKYKGESERQLAHSAIFAAIEKIKSEKEMTKAQNRLLELLEKQRKELELFSTADY
jgi:hypothetical protein